MATDTNLSQLVINKLTKAQYQEAKNAGSIVETEIYMITDGEEDYVTTAELDTAVDEAIGDMNLVYVSEENQESAVVPLNADTLNGQLPSYYAKATKLTPRNLLDNSDFTNPVNQRGQTSYTGSQYTIDRWRTFADSESVAVQNGYISKVGNLLQYVSGLDPSKVYTAAVCLYDGTIATYSNVLSSNIGSWLSLIYAQYNASTGLLAFRLTDNARDVKWAALYEGEYTIDTLPEYQPKGYGAELAECQRYYQKMNRAMISGWVTGSAKQYYMPLSLAVGMRILPTASIDGYCARKADGYSVRTGSSIVSPESLTVYSSSAYDCGNIMLIDSVTTAVDTNNILLGFQLNNVVLSADL